MNKFLVCIFLMAAIGCHQKNEKGDDNENVTEITAKSEDKAVLQYIIDVEFEIDSTLNLSMLSINSFKFQGRDAVSFLHAPSESICIYDYEDKRLIKKIILQQDGPNGIGPIDPSLGHLTITMDSTFIYNEWQRCLFVLNADGVVLKKYEWKNDTDNESHSTRPQVSSLWPMQKSGKFVRLPLTMNDPSVFDFDFTKMPAVLTVNIMTGEKTFEGFFSSRYNAGYWTTYSWKYTNAFYFDMKGDFLLFASPIDKTIYLKRGQGLKKLHIPSNLIPEINPMNPHKSLRERGGIGTKEENDKYVLTNPEFHYITKDPASENFVRMAYLRPSEIEESTRFPSPSLYMVIDSTFNHVSETVLPGKYRADIFFINEKGLHVLDYEKSLQSEDKLIFGLFRITG
ncbi:MAG: DUF4221 family protein [Cyclobacteriaceae bacterium]